MTFNNVHISPSDTTPYCPLNLASRFYHIIVHEGKLSICEEVIPFFRRRTDCPAGMPCWHILRGLPRQLECIDDQAVKCGSVPVYKE